MTPLESKLRRLAGSLDAAALEALASKGLLRRAQKDFERGDNLRIEGEMGGALRVCVGENEVKLPESGPATATCSCPAVGVCQHILTAVLLLQQPALETPGEAAAPEPTDSPEKELLAITPQQLEEWAGKAAFKAGLKIASQATPEILRERGIRIRFSGLNADCHYVSGGGLDGMIVSGGKADPRQMVVAAVIGFQRTQGVEWAVPAGLGALEASEGTPRSRSDVLEACQSLLMDTLANGLARLSSANQQRWATLAVSAVGVNLPRLALSLRGLSDEVSLTLNRDARSDMTRMLGRMAQTHALCSALQNRGESPRADLVGAHRTRYDEIGHLDLQGVAAWPWRTASGYHGLTVLFWDPSAKRWNSWSESRPSHQTQGFDPTARYTQPGPWEGAESPRKLARSSFRLMHAKRNSSNRLSSSGKSRALVTGPANLRDLPAIEDWALLAQQVGSQASVGLRENNPLNSIFALKAATWGNRGYDAVTQVFSWWLLDAQQRPLLLELAFDELAKPAIQWLEGARPESFPEAIVVGRVQRTSRGLTLQPFSIRRPNEEAVQIYLDNVSPTATVINAPKTDEEDENFEDEDVQADDAFGVFIGPLLDEADDALRAVAEGGLAAPNPLRIERIRQVIPRVEQLGLQGLAAGLGRVVAQPGPFTVLRCSYLNHLHRRAGVT